MAAKPTRFRVIPHEQGLTLRNLLARRVRELDRESAAKLIRAGGVYINRLRVRLPQVLVAPGERVTAYLEALDAVPFEPEQLVIVHREPEFIVIDKPAGVPVVPVRETAVGCVSEALVHLLESEGVKRPYVGVVHRLDRGASGLVLFTTRGAANKSLHKLFAEHQIRRTYRVRVRPQPAHPGPPPLEITCDAPLIKRSRGGVEIGDAKDPKAKRARTHFRRVAELPPLEGEGADYLLDVELETGRTHQIRAHAAHLGFPIVGDHRYGEDAKGERSDEGVTTLCLHAWTLEFEHPLGSGRVRCEAPLPDWAQPSPAYR